jgi:hypothetical protein
MKNYSKHLEIIVNKMFDIAGYDVTYRTLVGRKDDWYDQYTMTEEQSNEWIEWSCNYLVSKRLFGKKVAKLEMSMVNLNYGLKIKNNS